MGTSTSVPVKERGSPEDPKLPEDEHPDVPATHPLSVEFERLKKELESTLQQKNKLPDNADSTKKERINQKLEALTQLKTLFEKYYSEQEEKVKLKIFEELKKGKKDLLSLIDQSNEGESTEGHTVGSQPIVTEGHSTENEKTPVQVPREAKKDLSSPPHKTRPQASKEDLKEEEEKDKLMKKSSPTPKLNQSNESLKSFDNLLKTDSKSDLNNQILNNNNNNIQNLNNKENHSRRKKIEEQITPEKSLKAELESSDVNKSSKNSKSGDIYKTPQKTFTDKKKTFETSQPSYFLHRSSGLKPSTHFPQPQNFGLIFWKSPLRGYF